MTWRGSYYTEIMLDRFLLELWPFVSFSHFIYRNSCLHNSSYISQEIWWNFPVIVSMTWRWSCFIGVMLDRFLPELWSFGIFLTVSLVSATPLAVFSGSRAWAQKVNEYILFCFSDWNPFSLHSTLPPPPPPPPPKKSDLVLSTFTY